MSAIEPSSFWVNSGGNRGQKIESDVTTEYNSTGEDLGIILSEIDDVQWLRESLDKLWSIIDDIDTADDMCKENDSCFRRFVMKKQKERFEVLVSDGYSLYKPKGVR